MLYDTISVLHLKRHSTGPVDLQGGDVDYQVTEVATIGGFVSSLDREDIDVILLDILASQPDRFSVLRIAKTLRPEVACIFIADRGNEEDAVAALHAGAADFILTNKLKRLADAVQRGVRETRKTRHELRAKKRLIDRELGLRALVEAAPLPIFLIDTSGRVRDVWNPAAEQVFGWKREEVLNQQLPIIPEGNATEHMALRKRVAGGEGLAGVKIRRLRKNGGLVDIKLYTAPMRNAHGAVTRIISVLQDISEQKRAEEALRESRQRYEEFADALPLPAFESDTRGRLTFANRAAFAVLGYTQEDFSAGLNIFKMVIPEQRERVEILFQTALLGGTSGSEHVMLRKDGSTFTAVIHSSPIVRDKVVAGLRGVIIDISERKKAEEELRKSEERLQKVFRSSPAVITLSTLKEGRFVDVNETFERTLGYSKAEAIGKTASELGIWAEFAERSQLIEKLRGGGPVRGVEAQFVTRSGAKMIGLLSGETIDIGGRLCMLSIVHDITERLNLEAQLRQAQKMESIGLLAAGVAHDFNNILTVIQGHAGLLTSDPTLRPGSRASLQQISKAAQRAAEVTGQLLAFSRKQVIQPCSLDLNEVIQHLTDLLQRLVGETITLKFHPAPGLPSVNADPSMLEQIVLNLVVNSRDAMPRGGVLEISTSVARIDAQQCQQNSEASPGEHVCLKVSDSGSGIPLETLDRIFEPFFTTKEAGKGTGLGLSMVYGIVKQHRGWIEVSTARDQGTSFLIYLPTAELPPNQEGPTPPKREGTSGNETVLVVEDEDALRTLVSSVLTSWGYRVVTASDGNEALDVWKNHRNEIDLLLTDLVIPGGISGFQLAETLSSDNPQLKVIYTSGYSEEMVDRHPQGFFLQKPYHPAKLASIVRDCLES